MIYIEFTLIDQAKWVTIRRKLIVQDNFRRQTNLQKIKTPSKEWISGWSFAANKTGDCSLHHPQNHENNVPSHDPSTDRKFYDMFFRNFCAFASKEAEINDEA